jgi:hypothetical protein
MQPTHTYTYTETQTPTCSKWMTCKLYEQMGLKYKVIGNRSKNHMHGGCNANSMSESVQMSLAYKQSYIMSIEYSLPLYKGAFSTEFNGWVVVNERLRIQWEEAIVGGGGGFQTISRYILKGLKKKILSRQPVLELIPKPESFQYKVAQLTARRHWL